MPHGSSHTAISTLKNQQFLIPKLVKLFNCIKTLGSVPCQLASKHIHPTMLNKEATTLVNFLTSKFPQTSSSRMPTANCDDSCAWQVCEVKTKAKKSQRKLEGRDEQELACFTALLLASGHTQPQLTKEKQQEIDQVLQRIVKYYSIGELMESERMEIVKAIGLSRGHWFKCPNGHYYCIGECDRATEVGKCPDCKAEIGVTNYQLRSDNQLAPEMDGAQYPAWSQAANLANFNPDQLRNLL